MKFRDKREHSLKIKINKKFRNNSLKLKNKYKVIVKMTAKAVFKSQTRSRAKMDNNKLTKRVLLLTLYKTIHARIYQIHLNLRQKLKIIEDYKIMRNNLIVLTIIKTNNN